MSGEQRATQTRNIPRRKLVERQVAMVLEAGDVTCGLARRRLACGMERLQKRDKRRGFRWTQVLSVGRHVAAPLNDLTNQLVLRQAGGDTVETRAPFTAGVAKGVTVAALFRLEHQRALSLQRRRAAEHLLGDRVAA